MKLEMRHIGKVYRTKSALTDINECFSEAGVYGLLGPNGAGKTTLLNILATVLPASEGHVYWDGEAMEKLGAAYRSLIGFLPQKMDFYSHFTGYDFLKYLYVLKGGTQKKPKQLNELLERLHLETVSRQRIGTYSGGMKQRLAIAQAFIGKPELLLLDEPTVGLDLEERAEFKKMIRERGKEAIVILSTHIISDVEETADSVLFMGEGEVTGRFEEKDYRNGGLEEHYFRLTVGGL